MLDPRPALPRALVVFAAIALSILPLATAQNGGNFFAGINYSAGFPVNPTYAGGYYGGGISPVQVLSGDFNGDGKLDLVEAVSCEAPYLPNCPATDISGGYQGVVAVYLGNGDGTFGAPILTGTGLHYDSIRSIAVGDFNNDGRLDVAAASDDVASGAVTILLGNGEGGFDQISQFPMNGAANSANTLAVGDFNGDGKLDLVVGLECYGTGCTSRAIAVYLGDGAGNLGTPTYYPSLATYQLVPVVADFNGDGKPDVVVIGWYSSNDGIHSYMTVLLNAGNGTFNDQGTITIQAYGVQDTVSADFNGDGKQDLAVVTPSGGVYILFGNGNGTFQAPVRYPQVGYSPLTVTDLNGDGKPDLVVSAGQAYVNAVTPLINNGAGVFTVGATYPLGGYSDYASVVAGDFNGDGKPDVALTSVCSETSELDDHCPDGTLSVLLGNGDGTLQSVVPVSPTSSIHHVVLADINGDGIPDMVGTEDYYLSNEQNPGGVVVALGIGDGKFGPATEYPAAVSRPAGLAIADLNRDGHSDVVVTGYDVDTAEVVVLLGGKGGSLGAPNAYPLSQYYVGPPSVGDFGGNGKLGVAVMQQGYTEATSGAGVLLGNGDGTLQPEILTVTDEITPYQVVVGDFNKDGRADLAVYGGVISARSLYGLGAVTVLLGNGDGTFVVKPDNSPAGDNLDICDGDGCTFLQSYPTFGVAFGWGGGEGTTGTPLSVADLDGDGNLDLIIASECRLEDSSCSTGQLVYFHGLGDGTFNASTNDAPAQQLADANYLGVAVADVNGDGKPDIVASTLSGVAVYLAPFTAAGTIYATSGITDAEIPAIADINGDGAPDIAISNGGNSVGSAVVDLLFNRFPEPPAPTATALVSSADPATLGQAVTFTATVSAASGAAQAGTVTFTHGGVAYPAVSLVDGVASLTTSADLTVGAHTIRAVYSGTSTDAPSESAGLVETVLSPTTTAVASAANPSAPGAAVTLTATVSAASGAVPTGTVTFTHGGVAYPAVALNGGVATYSAAGLGAGSHTIRAVYSGSATDAASTSAPLTQVVLVATSTALAASPNPSALGQAVTFTATVTAASGSGQAGSTPTGTVTFTHGGVAYPAVALVNGVASLTTSAGLTVGTHTIRAVYSGSSTDAGSESGPVSEVVEQ
jgi:hypothetical protein